MLKKKGTRGSTLIALLAVLAALVAGPGAGSALADGGLSPDASWAEGV